MNIPLFERFKEMFSSHKEDKNTNDSLTAYMFNAVIEYGSYDHISYDLYVRDTIENCLTYIQTDRPRQINKIIEKELNGIDTAEEYKDLQEQDTYILCEIVKIRDYIFPNIK